MKQRQRPGPFRDPSYQLPPSSDFDEVATPLEKALVALKIGAICAATVTIVVLYLGTYAGVRLRQDFVSVVVVVAFVAPSAIAYVGARRARLRRKDGRREP